MHHRKHIAATLAVLAVFGDWNVHAAGQSSANFIIPKDTINLGTDNMASANFVLNGSVGDAVSTGPVASASFILSSGYRYQLDLSVPSMLNLISVFSRKVHGAAGTFDLPIDLAQVVSGAVTVEPRAIGAGHAIVFRFDAAVNVAGSAVSTDQASMPLGATSTMASGNEVIVTLTGVPDNRRLALTLTGVNGSTNANAAMGFLLGDVNGTRAVNATDISAIRTRAGQTATTGNFVHDLNASGTISAADITAVKKASGRALP